MTMPPHDSLALPASIRDLEHWVDRFTYRGYAFHELSIFAHAGRMYVCREEDVERLRACLYELDNRMTDDAIADVDTLDALVAGNEYGELYADDLPVTVTER